jgi:hypothetical protein
MGAMHFRFLPFALLSAMLIVCVVVTLLTGLWRLLWGPRRLAAWAWSALGLVPILLLIPPLEYARRQGDRNRRVPKNVFMDFALMVAATLGEGQARYIYACRLETERLVMFYNELATPERDAQAMDRHVAELERLLGGRLRAKIHWVRGTLLGEGEMQIYGLAVGSSASPGRSDAGPDSKSMWLDRHELAHAVIAQFAGPRANPPRFLSEGWAESQAGMSSKTLARHAIRLRLDDETPTLKELAGPEWYPSGRGEVYLMGGAIADFLIRQYGIERFLKLYRTCREHRFEADCVRILGADLEGLEALF